MITTTKFNLGPEDEYRVGIIDIQDNTQGCVADPGIPAQWDIELEELVEVATPSVDRLVGLSEFVALFATDREVSIQEATEEIEIQCIQEALGECVNDYT